MHLNIPFTIKMEKGGKLPFLDVLLEQNVGQLGHSLYRKSMHIACEVTVSTILYTRKLF